MARRACHADRQLVEIAGEVRRETDAAIKWFDGVRVVWLPKSEAEVSDDGRTVTLPQWLALEKRLI